ncbi:MAG: sulfatase [Myxococcales bacterium]|nr:sulfatase [Myxococcales bacterium]
MHRSLLFLCLLAGTAVAAPDAGYDLRANAPLAHVYRDGVVADAAAVGFVKYTRDMNGSWRTGIREDGRPGAYQPGLQTNLWFPIGPELASEDLVVEAVFKPIGNDQRMDAFINGKKVKSYTLQPGWQVQRFEVQKGAMPVGFNKVRLHFRRAVEYNGTKTGAAIRAVRVARASAPPLPADEAALAAALAPTEGDALNLPNGGGLDYYLVPPKGFTLTGTATGGEVEVFTQLDGKPAKKLGGGATLKLSLDAVAGQPVRLMLRGKGDVKLTGARLDGGKAQPLAGAKAPKYIVFWLIDTLRADKLDFYQVPNANKRPKVKTPALSALAKEATVFEPYWVQGNESKASHASFFTSTYPAVHGVYTQEAKLRDEHTTLAEVFKKAGYKTAGFVSNGYVSERWNFNQGFADKDFVNFIREGKANNAKAVFNAAKGYIEANKGTPFYLYLGTSDPHVTYRAHKEFIDQYDREGNYGGRYKKALSGDELGKIKGKKTPPSERDQHRIEALYENEVAFNDKWFGQLVETLKAQGIYDETMIIVSADHGDEFWEHGSCGHGHSLNQELVNVPLVIRAPGLFPAGKRATFGADGVDLLPTFQTLLGQAPVKDAQGLDLMPLVHAEGAVYPRATIASMAKSSYALQVGRAKVIMRSEQAISAFDAQTDSAEANDVFETRPVLALAALDPLSLFLSRVREWRKNEWGAPNVLTPAFK